MQISLEKAKALHDAGIEVRAEKHYDNYSNPDVFKLHPQLQDGKTVHADFKSYPAPNSDELLAVLPKEYNDSIVYYEISEQDGDWIVRTYDLDTDYQGLGNTLPDALADLLLKINEV